MARKALGGYESAGWLGRRWVVRRETLKGEQMIRIDVKAFVEWPEGH